MISLKQVRFLVVYVEVAYARILCLLRINKSTSPIPEGHYCYVYDEERNKKEPLKNGGYWIKPCKYYRILKGQLRAGCTYVGFIGWDVCLGDQCKICGEKEE